MKFPILYIPNNSTLIKVCLSILLSTFFILFFFQPFGDITHGYTFNGFLRILSYAIVASASVFSLEYYFGMYYRTKWSISQTRYGALIWYFIILLFVTINIFLCRTIWIGWTGVSWTDLGIVIYRVGIISIIPFSLIAFILLLQKTKKEDFEIHFTSQGTNPEHLRLNVNNLLYLTSEENYAGIYIWNGNQFQKKLLRGSLTFFEDQLEPPVVRVHRSYLVNLQQIIEVKMNSSGGSLILSGSDYSIPISRKYLTSFQNHWSRRN
ncbi:LytR/AlgR family response regulator transcription factor [Ekhidna sp.]